MLTPKMANFTIGPLICSGSKAKDIIQTEISGLKYELATKNEDLLSKINNSISQLDTKISDLDKEVKRKVFFQAKKNSGQGFRGKITFNEANPNIGDGMNADTGEFTAPQTGYYAFSISTMTQNLAGDISINVHKNNAKLFDIYDRFDEEDNIGQHWIEKLNTGDKIHLTVTGTSKLFSHPNYPFYFTGVLL